MSKATIATVTSKGQITLPVELRRSLNLKPGDKVSFERDADGRFVLGRTKYLADLRGFVKVDRLISLEELDSWIAEARGRKVEAVGDDGDR